MTTYVTVVFREQRRRSASDRVVWYHSIRREICYPVNVIL